MKWVMLVVLGLGVIYFTWRVLWHVLSIDAKVWFLNKLVRWIMPFYVSCQYIKWHADGDLNRSGGGKRSPSFAPYDS